MTRHYSIGIEKHYKEQVRVYRELAEALTKILPVIEEFNGKVINVRFLKRLRDYLNIKDFNLTLNDNTNDDGKFIRIYNSNRSYQVGDFGCGYVEENDTYFNVDRVLDKDKTIAEIKKEFNNLHNKANRLSDAIDNLKVIQEKYKMIAKQIDEFNSDIPYQLRDEFKLKWGN